MPSSRRYFTPRPQSPNFPANTIWRSGMGDSPRRSTRDWRRQAGYFARAHHAADTADARHAGASVSIFRRDGDIDYYGAMLMAAGARIIYLYFSPIS